MKWILYALALAALVGPGQAASAPAAVQKAIANPTDSQILTAIRAKMVKSKVAADHFKFTVQNGIVTIEGQTAVTQHKGVATRIARTSGAAGVRNLIQVSADAKAKTIASLSRGATGTTVAAPGGRIERKAAAESAAPFAPPPPALARAAVIPPSQ